jgi:hypothetical protein
VDGLHVKIEFVVRINFTGEIDIDIAGIGPLG